MTTDRVNQTVILNDERQLGFAEYGDSSGKPVFHFNGSGGSRLEQPSDLSILADLGIRLICTDRPGHGISDPQPGRKLLDWPDDVGQLADHLGIDRFHVMGWSAGGPHALVCAYKLSERISAGALVSGFAPPDRPKPYAGFSFVMKMLIFLARSIPALVNPYRRLTYNMLQGDPEKVIDQMASSFPPEDITAIEESGSKKMLFENLREGYKQGWDAPAQDDIIINSSWGFKLKDVATRFDIWQGEADKNVPVNLGEYQHEILPNSRLRILPGKAHLYLLTHWREVLDALVT